MANNHKYIEHHSSNQEKQTDLYTINRPDFFIPVAMNNNPIITFVNEMCTSTDIVQIRRTASLIL